MSTLFSHLSDRLSETVARLRGQGRLTESNIQDSLREIRIALLEADVALPVLQQLLNQIQTRAIGQEVLKSVSPGQAFVKVVNDELVNLMKSENQELSFKTEPPAVFLMAGLQGSGKTTTVAKLARYLKERLRKKVLVASCDIYRPAAIEQLQTLAKQLDIPFYSNLPGQNPVAIATSAIDAAKRQVAEVVLIDTAGRLHIDDAMMAEIKDLHQAINPIETLFVIDSMTGQDAVNSARAFHEALPLTGIILTKVDGDSRGGAALSVRNITGKPIKFIGTGEKTDALEPFLPERIVSRILGMGDILSLVEEAQQKLDRTNAERMAKKIKKGSTFDLEDFLVQLKEMRKMGGASGLLAKLPMLPNLPAALKSKLGDDGQFKKMEAIIYSMTPKERRYPDLLKASRKKRVAAGSGTQIQDINRMLTQFEQMQKMLKKMGRAGGMAKMMGMVQGLMGQGGKLPPF